MGGLQAGLVAVHVTSLLAVEVLDLRRGSGTHARVLTVVIQRVNGQNSLVHAFGVTTINIARHMHDERLPRAGCPSRCRLRGSSDYVWIICMIGCRFN